MTTDFNPIDHPIIFSPYQRKASTFWAEHVPFAMFLVEIVRPRVIVELGTLYGVSYCSFCQVVKDLKLEARCYAVDTWEGDPHQGIYDDAVLQDLRQYHDPLYSEFSTLLRATFDDAVLKFEDRSIDLLHIDGYHTYEAVKHDFETWFPKLSERGVIIFHDTNVLKDDFGVWKLWGELKEQYPSFEFLHGSGLGIIAVGENYPIALNELFHAKADTQDKIRDLFQRLGQAIDLSIKLDEVSANLSGIQSKIADFYAQMAHVRTQNAQLTAQLTALQNRFVYRFLARIRGIADLLLPLGTGRRSFIVSAYRSTKALLTGGFQELLREVRSRKQALPDNASNDGSALQSANALNTTPIESGFHNKVYNELVRTSLNIENYDYVPLAQDHYSSAEVPVKLIAYYLPQFHPIPENDMWWGKGFTEWTNVSKAVPQFVGHYQPHLPGELGFYDLRIPEVQRRQVELARQYGIHGFCFYYYWFQGKRLLELPLNNFMNDPQIDFPFCICWANENWTRRWDGQESDLLIGQVHSDESDMKFIQDVAPILQHKNYIKINGQPILIIYRANILPNPAATAARWREYCKSIGMNEPYLIAAQTFNFQDPHKVGFDAAVEFPPHSRSQNEITSGVSLVNENYQGHVIDYSSAVKIFNQTPNNIEYTLFKTVFPSWDNEARKPGRGYTFAFSTPDAYKKWLQDACEFALTNDDPAKRLVFINAWNEWAEGTHLEPDRRHGYAYLQATVDALRTLPKKS